MKPIVPYPKKHVEFLAYDERASEVARFAANIIQDTIPEVIVEHVGSTAIAGCAGRGVIDLMILYDSNPLEPILIRLDDLGFQWVQRNPIRTEDWPKGMGGIYFDGELFRLHIHVQNINDPTVSDKRSFRDKLRLDASLREAYMSLKQDILGSGVDDPIQYTSAKAAFVQQVLENEDL
jgi:GrpB-like predicted nucleotidyltransferase (UPF0157 family)